MEPSPSCNPPHRTQTSDLHPELTVFSSAPTPLPSRSFCTTIDVSSSACQLVYNVESILVLTLPLSLPSRLRSPASNMMHVRFSSHYLKTDTINNRRSNTAKLHVPIPPPSSFTEVDLHRNRCQSGLSGRLVVRSSSSVHNLTLPLFTLSSSIIFSLRSSYTTRRRSLI